MLRESTKHFLQPQFLQILENKNESLLSFYKRELPKRVGSFRLPEVGPIMSYGTEAEIEGYANKQFVFNGRTDKKPIDMSNGMDWYTAPEGDLEWNGGFVRHGHVLYLADQYKKTNDERFAEAAIDQMLDYITNIPPFNPEGQPYLTYKKSTWRPFEAAARAAENWPPALSILFNSPYLTEEKWETIFCSIYEHAVFLSKHHWKKGNHACLECADLAIISLFFKEFKESEQWISYCMGVLMQLFEDTFFADGYSKEMSGAYHYIAMRNFHALYEVAVRNDRQDIFPKAYIEILKKAALAEFYQQKPDYSLPVTNDSNLNTNHRVVLEKLAGLVPQEWVKFRLSQGREGVAPPQASYFYPDAKLGVMRSSWKEDALWLGFDMGPWGHNHMNQDQLNVELSAYGRNFLVNCGRWRYTTSPGIAWKDTAQYFKSSFAYNTVVVDGLEQMPDDATGSMTINERYDYAKGIFDKGYGRDTDEKDEEALKTTGQTAFKTLAIGNIVHTRQVIFVKPHFFLVVDDLQTDDKTPRQMEQIWHFAPCNLHVCPSGQYANTQFSDANLIVVPFEPKEQTTQLLIGSQTPFGGFFCPEYDVMEQSPELRFKKEFVSSTVMETLLFPVRGKVFEIPTCTKTKEKDKVVYTIFYNNETYVIVSDNKGLHLQA